MTATEESLESEVRSLESGLWESFVRLGAVNVKDFRLALQTSDYLFPCAILSASGKARSRIIANTPNKGPGARIMKA